MKHMVWNSKSVSCISGWIIVMLLTFIPFNAIWTIGKSYKSYDAKYDNHDRMGKNIHFVFQPEILSVD